MRLILKYRINSERVKIKMERAGQTEIFRHKRTPLVGVPHFLLPPAQSEINVHLQNIPISTEFVIFLRHRVPSRNFSDLSDCNEHWKRENNTNY